MQLMIKKDTDDLKAIGFNGMIFDLIFLAAYESVQQMVDDVSSSDEELNLSQGYIDLDPSSFVQPEGNRGCWFQIPATPLEAKCIYFLKLDKSVELYSMVNPHDTISLDEAVKSLEDVGYNKYQ